jgi:Ser/Thr protein kinase RdoA (MazF antagonist)
MGMNGIFIAGDGVLLRVSRPTAPPEQAVWLARLLARYGLRVPVYLHDEAFAADGHAVFAIAAVVEDGMVDWIAVGHMIARLHMIDPGEVAGGYPLPFCGDFPWWDFTAVMNEVGGDLDGRSHAAISAAINRCRPLLDQQRAGDLVVCHGDVHPGNVIQSAQGPVLLDWDLVCRGPAAWDHAPLMTWTERWGGEADIYEAFAAGYGRSLRSEAVAEAIAELRLVAATLMRVRAIRSNPSATAEAELRLRYWRGEADAPAWHAQ